MSAVQGVAAIRVAATAFSSILIAMLALVLDSFDSVPGKRPSTPHIVRSFLRRGCANIQSQMISAKCVTLGEERYDAGGRRHVVYPGRFLLAAPDEALDLSVQSTAKGCCIYLDVSDVRKMLGQMTSEDIEGGHKARIDYCTIALPIGGSDFGTQIDSVARRRGDGNAQELSASLAELLGAISALNDRLPFKRAAVRRELIARLETARAYLLDVADRPIKLEDVERAARLSRFHLSRSFAHAYGEPPLRFHQNIRLDAAAERVRAGEPLALIASELGFSNISSFSRAYFRRHGRRPSIDQREKSNMGA